MKQIIPNTPLNDDLNYEMITHTDSGYKSWSNNYINLQLTQIKQILKANYTITQNQALTSINYNNKLT